MKEEIAKILKMIEEGKIGAAEGMELIKALEEDQIKIKQPEFTKQEDKMLKVRVTSGNSDKVNVTLPLKFVKAIIRATGQIPINFSGIKDPNMTIDTQAILEAIDSGMEGKFVDIHTEKGDVVEVSIE